LIIGSGPAGYTAGIYTGRADLKPLLYEGLQPGGQLTITTEIENFPGYPEGISGTEMMAQLKQQALRFGTDVRSGYIVKADFSKRPFHLVDDHDNEIEAEAVIIATGASARWLGLESEKKLYGQGVSACATCDGYFYKGLEVAVVGGGDVALEYAIFLSRFASKVYLIHRRDAFRGAMVLQEQVKANEKIEIIYDTVVDEVVGKDAVKCLRLSNKKTGEQWELPVNGVFMAVGILPNTEGLAGLPNTNEAGYIEAGEDGVTSIPGVFAAGDVRTKQLRQVITACSDGANCITSASRYLENVK
jgi:thioredoxin reductase (NADPH)